MQPLWKTVWKFLKKLKIGYISKIPYDPSVPLVGIYQKRNPLIQKELTSVHCCCSAAQLCPTLCDPMECSTLSFTISQSLLKLMSIELVIHPTNSSSVIPFSCLQSFPTSGSFPMSQLFTLAKVLELQHQSFHEHSGLIFFRMDWFDLLAVQGTLKSLLQHHSSKASILQCSVFFMAQSIHYHWKNNSFD